MRTALEETPSLSAPMVQIDPVPRVSIQAFCESPEAAAIIQAAIGDRRMNKAHVKQNMGGAAAAVEAYRNAPTPNVATPAPRSSSSARSTTSCSTASSSRGE
jgi:pilus assembly protein CpaE